MPIDSYLLKVLFKELHHHLNFLLHACKNRLRGPRILANFQSHGLEWVDLVKL